MLNRRYIGPALALLLLVGVLAGCGNQTPASPSDTAPLVQPSETPAAEPVTLLIAGGWEDCKAIESVGRDFTAVYPNCTVVYEYLQDYSNSLPKRMEGEDAVDLFFTTNIQADSPLYPYALDLKSCPELDLSGTFPGLIENFSFMENGQRTDKLYAIPLGGEMRGLYVNKTLLASLGLAVPTDRTSLLEACAALKSYGFIPFHGNPSSFGQTLIYPWVCNLIANAEDPQAAFDAVNSRSAVISQIFREPFAFLYGLVEQDYYDYKTAQTELGLFLEMRDVDYAADFFHIKEVNGSREKVDDVGQVAFLPAAMSLRGVMEKTKEDYHSEIEYVFIPAPLGEDGGFVYMSPAHGIAANGDSDKTEWSIRFLNFLFEPENNKRFAEEFNVLPNTEDSYDYIAGLFDLGADHISHVGQVTFVYPFYETIAANLLNIAKGNNPKYMQENPDGTKSMYPFDYYMNQLDESIAAHE